MIIKYADDKQPQLAALQGLMNHPGADATTKKRIEQEIRNIQAGIRGEAEAAYEMKVRYGESENWMILHDLRIEHEGLVAQIDHLIINRWLEMWVCESKHFSEGVAINEHGEFTAFFGNKPYGVPSPIEQNNKHILILKRLFDSGAVKLPTRLGITIKPELKTLVVISKGARISRPKVKIDDVDCIIKSDQLFKAIDKSVDGNSSLMAMTRIIGCDTLKNLAREIVKLHKPIQFNWMAKFGLSEPIAPPIKQPVPVIAPIISGEELLPVTTDSQNNDEPVKPKVKMICQSCSQRVTYTVAKFCWANKPKFGGLIYCMDCQKAI